MADPKNLGLRPTADDPLAPPRPAQPRAVGSPLPTGSSRLAASNLEPRLAAPAAFSPANGASPAGRAMLESGTPPASAGPSGLQRAVSAFRAAIPYVQRILPLLDGNIGAAVSNMLAPHHHAPPAPPPPPPVDLVPLQDGLAALATRQNELCDQVAEQNSSLKRVEDRLEMVREATDRNTLEQQELMDDLKGVGRKVNLFAGVVLGLLVISVIINLFLYLRIVKLFP
jgi:tetrahydromethanopterin S-methyltransferase subunit G